MSIKFLLLLLLLLLSLIILISAVSCQKQQQQPSPIYTVCKDSDNVIPFNNSQNFICYSVSDGETTSQSASSYETSTGKLIWTQDQIFSFGIGQVRIFEPASLLYVQNVAIDLATGKILWKTHAGHECFSSYYGQSLFFDSYSQDFRNQDDDVILIACTIDMVFPVWALNASNGDVLWTQRLPRMRFSSAGNVVRHIFPVTVDNKVWGFDTKTGAAIWTNSESFPNPLNNETEVVNLLNEQVPDLSNKFLTIDAAQAMYDFGNVILGKLGTSEIFAVNASNGKILWNSTSLGLFDDSQPKVNSRLHLSAVTVKENPSTIEPRAVVVFMNVQNEIELRDAQTAQLVGKTASLFDDNGNNNNNLQESFQVATTSNPFAIWIFVYTSQTTKLIAFPPLFEPSPTNITHIITNFLFNKTLPAQVSSSASNIQFLTTGFYTNMFVGLNVVNNNTSTFYLEVYCSAMTTTVFTLPVNPSNNNNNNNFPTTLTLLASPLHKTTTTTDQGKIEYVFGVMIPGSGLFVYLV